MASHRWPPRPHTTMAMRDEEDIHGGQEVPRGNAISGGNRAYSKRDPIIQSLILAAILALVGAVWRLGDNMTRLEATYIAKEQQHDRDILRIDNSLDRYDKRITDLERGEGTRQPDPYYRQKR